jgi:hypothetical protein
MIGVIVTFRYGNDFSEERVGKIAETARPRFEGMPGLRSKAFTFDPAKREATNFYVWDSEDAARKFFTEQTIGGGCTQLQRPNMAPAAPIVQEARYKTSSRQKDWVKIRTPHGRDVQTETSEGRLDPRLSRRRDGAGEEGERELTRLPTRTAARTPRSACTRRTARAAHPA